MTNVIATYIEKLKKIDGDIRAQAAVAIKIRTKRKLTSGEIAMSQLVFKDSIDYSNIKKGVKLTISGKIEEYNGKPEIILTEQSQIIKVE